MPIFQTFEDYDKWRRRQLLERLQNFEGFEAPNSVAAISAEPTGMEPKSDGPSAELAQGLAPNAPMGGELSAGLQAGVDPSVMNSDPLSGALAEGIESPRGSGFTNALDDQEDPQDQTTTGPGPNNRVSPLTFVEDTGDFWMEATDNTLGVNGVDQENYTQSLWFQMPDPGGAVNFTLAANLPATREQRVNIVGLTGEDILISVITFSGSVYNVTTTGVVNFDEPNHVFLSGSSTDASDAFTLWINGIEIITTTWGFAAGVTSFEYWWGTDDGATYDGLSGTQFADYYIAQEYVPDPTGLFITGPNGDGLDGGSDGTGYTGTTPYVWISGGASVWNAGTNAGAGGDFTVNGTVIDV